MIEANCSNGLLNPFNQHLVLDPLHSYITAMILKFYMIFIWASDIIPILSTNPIPILFRRGEFLLISL
jgi:hypothetical protein